jgi:hypothetical protein
MLAEAITLSLELLYDASETWCNGGKSCSVLKPDTMGGALNVYYYQVQRSRHSKVFKMNFVLPQQLCQLY